MEKLYWKKQADGSLEIYSDGPVGLSGNVPHWFEVPTVKIETDPPAFSRDQGTKSHVFLTLCKMTGPGGVNEYTFHSTRNLDGIMDDIKVGFELQAVCEVEMIYYSTWDHTEQMDEAKKLVAEKLDLPEIDPAK